MKSHRPALSWNTYLIWNLVGFSFLFHIETYNFCGLESLKVDLLYACEDAPGDHADVRGGKSKLFVKLIILVKFIG